MVAVIGDSARQAASIALHAAAGFKHIGILPDTASSMAAGSTQY